MYIAWASFRNDHQKSTRHLCYPLFAYMYIVIIIYHYMYWLIMAQTLMLLLTSIDHPFKPVSYLPVRKIQQDSTGSPVGQRQESVWNLIFSLIPNRTVRCLHFPRGIFYFSTWKINKIPVRILAWQKYCRPKSVFHKCVNN